MSTRSLPLWTYPVETSFQSMQSLRPSRKNDHMIVGSRQMVRTFSLDQENENSVPTLSPIRSTKGTTATTCVAFHPFADCVFAAGGANGEVALWYYGTQNIAALNDKWVAHSRAIHGLEFLVGATAVAHLVTASADGELNLWELSSVAGTGKKEIWRKSALLANFRPEGFRSGLRDLDCRLADVKYQQSFMRKTISTFVYELLVACDDGSAELYVSLSVDPRSIGLKFKVPVSTQTINSARFAPGDAPMFATGGKDSYIRVYSWDRTASSNNPPTLLYSIRTISSVWGVRWRPSGKCVAACHSVMDASIYVWDVESRLMPAYVFNSHRDNVTDFFWADNHHIVSCSRDNTIQLHEIKRAIIPIEQMRTVNISFSPSCLASLNSVVNRDKFEKMHDKLNLNVVKLKGYGGVGDTDSTETEIVKLTGASSARVARELRMQPVPFGLGFTIDGKRIIAILPLVIRFLSDLADAAKPAEENVKICFQFLSRLARRDEFSTQAECMLLLLSLSDQAANNSYAQELAAAAFQNAVSVYQTLNDVVTALCLGSIVQFVCPQAIGYALSPNLVRWSNSVIETLRRFHEHILACQFIHNSPFTEIRSVSHNKTSFNLASQCCKKERAFGDDKCSKCQKEVNICCLCGDSVKGLWLSCAGCGHGGHLKHIRAWFKSNSACPNPNCQHRCLITYRDK